MQQSIYICLISMSLRAFSIIITQMNFSLAGCLSCLTATLPCVVLFIGIVGRRRLFLILGFGFALFSLITLRMYVHVAPPWVVLTGAGILLLIVAGLLRRFLDSGVNGERAGFTAAPLTEPQEKHRGVEILASVATMTPSAPAAAENSQFHGDGGQFGGGGASGNF